MYWTKEKTSNKCIKEEDKQNTQKKKKKNNVRNWHSSISLSYHRIQVDVKCNIPHMISIKF